MLVDAVFPAASELVMVYAGAVATGAFVGIRLTLFGHVFGSGFAGYLAAALAGQLTPRYAAIATAVSVGAYAVARGLAKLGPTTVISPAPPQ